jgi:hypothetical protein
MMFFYAAQRSFWRTQNTHADRRASSADGAVLPLEDAADLRQIAACGTVTLRILTLCLEHP